MTKTAIEADREKGDYTVARHDNSMELIDGLNESLATLGYLCDAMTEKDIGNVQRCVHGLMRDDSFRADMLRAYYYFIWSASQDNLADDENVQSVLEGAEEFRSIDTIRQRVMDIFDKFCQMNQMPKVFTDVDTARQCLREQLAFFGHTVATKDRLEKYDEQIQKAINFVLRQQYLNKAWSPLIVAYLANPFAGEMERMADMVITYFAHPAQKAKVLDIDDEGITIKIHRGIQRKEYLAIWDTIKDELYLAHDTNGTELLKSRFVFLHYVEKMSYGKIAKAYYPEYYVKKINGRQNAEDLVRHTIKQHGGVYVGRD